MKPRTGKTTTRNHLQQKLNPYLKPQLATISDPYTYSRRDAAVLSRYAAINSKIQTQQRCAQAIQVFSRSMDRFNEYGNEIEDKEGIDGEGRVYKGGEELPLSKNHSPSSKNLHRTPLL